MQPQARWAQRHQGHTDHNATPSRATSGHATAVVTAVKPKQPPRRWFCQWCGRERAPGQTWRAWCGYQCYVNGQGDKVLGMYHLARSVGWGGRDWRLHLVQHIAQRDGMTCQLCHQPVDLTLKSGLRGEDLGPSLDHIVPRAHGGPDTVENLQLTHWICNKTRRNAPLVRAE
jgi:hypothetical protein